MAKQSKPRARKSKPPIVWTEVRKCKYCQAAEYEATGYDGIRRLHKYDCDCRKWITRGVQREICRNFAGHAEIAEKYAPSVKRVASEGLTIGTVFILARKEYRKLHGDMGVFDATLERETQCLRLSDLANILHRDRWGFAGVECFATWHPKGHEKLVAPKPKEASNG